MSNDIEKFDPSSLMDGVKQRIKATFVSLIPDDQWDALCQRLVSDFMQDKRAPYSGADPIPSEFKQVVFEVLRESAKEHIKIHMQKYDSPGYNSFGPVVNDTLKTLITENAQNIFVAMIEKSMQEVIQNMKNRSY